MGIFKISVKTPAGSSINFRIIMTTPVIPPAARLKGIWNMLNPNATKMAPRLSVNVAFKRIINWSTEGSLMFFKNRFWFIAKTLCAWQVYDSRLVNQRPAVERGRCLNPIFEFNFRFLLRVFIERVVIDNVQVNIPLREWNFNIIFFESVPYFE